MANSALIFLESLVGVSEEGHIMVSLICSLNNIYTFKNIKGTDKQGYYVVIGVANPLLILMCRCLNVHKFGSFSFSQAQQSTHISLYSLAGE